MKARGFRLSAEHSGKEDTAVQLALRFIAKNQQDANDNIIIGTAIKTFRYKINYSIIRATVKTFGYKISYSCFFGPDQNRHFSAITKPIQFINKALVKVISLPGQLSFKNVMHEKKKGDIINKQGS